MKKHQQTPTVPGEELDTFNISDNFNVMVDETHQMENGIGGRQYIRWTEQCRIHFGDITIAYEVIRSERRKKTFEIRVGSYGVRVFAPVTTPDSHLETFVRERAPWILRNYAEAKAKAEPIRFISGETLPYLGRNVRMIVREADVSSPQIRFQHWRFQVEAPRDLAIGERAQLLYLSFVEWYRACAEKRLPQHLERWRPRIESDIQPRVLIRDQRRRWASCANDGTVRFNWRVIMLKPALIDYIVVHELAHLVIRNHSADFWRLVTEIMPDAQDRRQRLKEINRLLPF